MHLSQHRDERLLLRDLPFPEKNLSDTSLLLADMRMVICFSADYSKYYYIKNNFPFFIDG